MKKYLSVIVLLLMAANIFGQDKASQIQDLLGSANRLRAANNEALAITKYESILKLDPGHFESLHSAALLYTRVGNRFSEDDQSRKEDYYRKAKSLADRALAAQPNSAEAQFVMSVAVGRMGLISPTKERVASSKEVKKHAEEAIRLDPKHAGAWDVLGRWNSKVANLSFAEKAAANLLFGGIPEGASNENAVNCFTNALKYKPNYILYMYDLATAYYQVKNITKCKEMLNKLIKLAPKTQDDPGIQKEAKMMLASLK